MQVEGDGWTMNLGDCIEGMRTLHDEQADIVICDPPYEAEAHTLQRRSKVALENAVDRTQVAQPAPLSFAAITDEQRTEAWCLVFCQVEAAHKWAAALSCTPFGVQYVRTMIWVKPGAQPQFSGDRPGMGYESIVVAHRKGRKRWNGGGRVGVFECPPPRNAIDAPHETTKPLPLMRELVSLFSDHGELVLDPFAGSGSTGVACRQLGRRFLGWELNRDYFDIACRRLRGEEAKPNPAQPSLFG
jgi:site-specific DNA-methyltransferase (adenine-specific)